MVSAPVRDQLLALKCNARIHDVVDSEKFSEADKETIEAIVDGIAQFAAGQWAPLNQLGDKVGAQFSEGDVTLPDGFRSAYRSYVEQGWNAIAGPLAYGGQGLPFSLACCVLEALGTANMGFALLPVLTVGAIDALAHHGSERQKALYLPRLISGEWSGTMNLTEPQAGSDVGALRSAASLIETGPHAGKYRIKGTKIFITWGEHDLTENIIHLVLARTPGAPSGSRGISLFVVPKYMVNEDGSLGQRNDLRAVSIEHKLGIHASPTCVMSFGDNDECIGELIGVENEGLKYMFTMMNSARINVGSQGIQVAEAATRRAMVYAMDRVQSARAGSHNGGPVPIVEHPDVRRMLVRMRALSEAGRALLYYTAGLVDRGAMGHAQAQARADLLVPMLKAWGTDIGCEVASLGVQVHGGMGFIEETGAAQYYRDARIAPIYEGTNGIQAADLVLRKLQYDKGQVYLELMEQAQRECTAFPDLVSLASECIRVARWMTEQASIDDKLAGSVPFCTMSAVVVAGWQLVSQAHFSDAERLPQAEAKRSMANYFCKHIVAETFGLTSPAMAGSDILYKLSASELADF